MTLQEILRAADAGTVCELLRSEAGPGPLELLLYVAFRYCHYHVHYCYSLLFCSL